MSDPSRPVAQPVDVWGETPSDVLDTPDAGVAAIRGGAMRISGYAICIAASVVSSALMLRHLGVVATGEYVTVLSLVTISSSITDGGLATIGVRELSTLPPARARSFFRNLAGARLLFIAGGMIFALAFALLSGYSTTMVEGVVFASIGFASLTTQTTYLLPLMARLRLDWVTAVETLRQIGAAVVVVMLVLIGAPLLPFWAATIPAGIVATALAAVLIRRSMPLLPAFDRAVLGPLIRRTLPYSLATAVGIVYFRLAILVMSYVSTGQQTGYYGASFRIVEALFVIPHLIVGSTLPIFARAARDDRKRLDYALGRTFEVCLLTGLAAGLALVTGSHFIIQVVAGPKFAPAAIVLSIQGVALVATFVGAVFGYGLLSLERYREVLVINLGVLLLSGLLTGVFASRYGALGAAGATTFVELLYTGLLALALVRAGARPQTSLAGMARFVFSALLGVPLLLVPGIPDVARPALAVAVYCAALLALGAVPREILVLIPGLRRKLPL